MALRIEIKSTSVGEQKISPKEGGKKFEEFTKVSQTGYAHGMLDRNGSPEAYAVKISIDLGTTKERRPPYPVGVYEIDDSSFFVGRYDDMQLGRLVLSPLSK